MAYTFDQLWNELIGELGNDLPPGAAKLYINKAWRRILNSRPWTFLLAEGYLLAPAAITGDLAVTQYSQVMVPSVALKAILDALSSPPLIGRRSIRINPTSGSISTIAPIYDILTYDPAGLGTITISRPYLDSTSSAISVTIYQRYFFSPNDYNNLETNDFSRFLSVKDESNNWTLNLNKSIRYIDLIDPNRTWSGTPTCLVNTVAASPNTPGVTFNGPIAPGTPRFELWPNYTSGAQKVYNCLYQRKGIDLTDDFGSVTSALPYQIDPEWVMTGARIYAYRYAMTNKGKYSAWAKTDFMSLIKIEEANWQDRFMELRRQDEETGYQNYVPRYGNILNNPGYWGADFLQTHSFGEFAGYYGY